MANTNVNALGFTRFEIANAKRALSANKTLYRKMDTLEKKIKELAAEYEATEAQTKAWEAPVAALTEQKLGVVLTSRQLLAYCANPEQFKVDYPDTVLPEAAPQEENNPFEA